jgi:hypothetical protein
LLLFFAAVTVAEQLLRDGDRSRDGDADRRARDDLLAGRHPFLLFHR